VKKREKAGDSGVFSNSGEWNSREKGRTPDKKISGFHYTTTGGGEGKRGLEERGREIPIRMRVEGEDRETKGRKKKSKYSWTHLEESHSHEGRGGVEEFPSKRRA